MKHIKKFNENIEYIRMDAEIQTENNEFTIKIHDYDDNAEIYGGIVSTDDTNNFEGEPLLYFSLSRDHNKDFSYIDLKKDEINILIKQLKRMLERM